MNLSSDSAKVVGPQGRPSGRKPTFRISLRDPRTDPPRDGTVSLSDSSDISPGVPDPSVKPGMATRCARCLSKELDYAADGTATCRSCGVETRTWASSIPAVSPTAVAEAEAPTVRPAWAAAAGSEIEQPLASVPEEAGSVSNEGASPLGRILGAIKGLFRRS